MLTLSCTCVRYSNLLPYLLTKMSCWNAFIVVALKII